MKTEESQDSFTEQISKSQLTKKQRSVLEAWTDEPTATLVEIADVADVAQPTASQYIRLYGWLYDEELWSERNWKGEPEDVKMEAISKKTSYKAPEPDKDGDGGDGKDVLSKPSESYRSPTSYSVGPPIGEIDGGDRLVARMEECSTIYEWSKLLNDYINWGNNSKVNNKVGIFNLGSAHDCVNRQTGNCQVGEGECYAYVDEERYDYVLAYFRRQEFVWDSMDVQTFTDALIEILNRRQTETRAIKFNQAGDFRHNGDIIKVNRIAERLDKYNVKVFAYSASNYLDWELASSDNLTIVQSNSIEDYGDRRYWAVDSIDDIPDDAVWCIYNRQKKEGMSKEERTKCGDCMMCIDDNAPDIAAVK